jgi:hypothetical protein
MRVEYIVGGWCLHNDLRRCRLDFERFGALTPDIAQQGLLGRPEGPIRRDQTADLR